MPMPTDDASSYSIQLGSFQNDSDPIQKLTQRIYKMELKIMEEREERAKMGKLVLQLASAAGRPRAPLLELKEEPQRLPTVLATVDELTSLDTGEPEMDSARSSEVPSTDCEDNRKPTYWRYAPKDGCDVKIRTVPDIDGERSKVRVHAGTVFEVCEELPCADGVTYLKLAEGGGWLFDKKPGVGVMCERLDIDSVEDAFPVDSGTADVMRLRSDFLDYSNRTDNLAQQCSDLQDAQKLTQKIVQGIRDQYKQDANKISKEVTDFGRELTEAVQVVGETNKTGMRQLNESMTRLGEELRQRLAKLESDLALRSEEAKAEVAAKIEEVRVDLNGQLAADARALQHELANQMDADVTAQQAKDAAPPVKVEEAKAQLAGQSEADIASLKLKYDADVKQIGDAILHQNELIQMQTDKVAAAIEAMPDKIPSYPRSGSPGAEPKLVQSFPDGFGQYPSRSISCKSSPKINFRDNSSGTSSPTMSLRDCRLHSAQVSPKSTPTIGYREVPPDVFRAVSAPVSASAPSLRDSFPGRSPTPTVSTQHRPASPVVSTRPLGAPNAIQSSTGITGSMKAPLPTHSNVALAASSRPSSAQLSIIGSPSADPKLQRTPSYPGTQSAASSASTSSPLIGRNVSPTPTRPISSTTRSTAPPRFPC